MILRILYSAYIGILLVVLFWIGLKAFFPGPKDYEPYIAPQNIIEYSKIIILIAGTFSLLLVTAGLKFLRRFSGIAEGSILGGILILVFQILPVTGFRQEDNVFIFAFILAIFVFSVLSGLKQFEE